MKYFLQNNYCERLFEILGVSFGGNNDSNDDGGNKRSYCTAIMGGAIELLGLYVLVKKIYKMQS